MVHARVMIALALAVAVALPAAHALEWTLTTHTSAYPKFAYRVTGAGVDNIDNPTITVNAGDVVTVWHDSLPVDQNSCVNTAPSVSGADRGPLYPNVEPFGARSDWSIRCLSGKGRKVITFPTAAAGSTVYLVAAAYTADPAHPPFVTIRVRPAGAAATSSAPAPVKPPRFASAKASNSAELKLKRARARRVRAQA